MRQALVAMVASVVVVGAIGTLQYIRASSYLAAGEVFRVGTTSSGQLSAEFAQRSRVAHYLEVGGELTSMRDSLFWFGDWSNLLGCVQESSAAWMAISAGLAGAMTLAPLLSTMMIPASRRVLRAGERGSADAVIAGVNRSVLAWTPILTLLAAPIVWWLVSDRAPVRCESFDQWPGVPRDGSKTAGIALLAAFPFVAGVLVAMLAARCRGLAASAQAGLCPWCGYERAGESGRFPLCPECGRSHDSPERGTWTRVAALGAGALAIALVGVVATRGPDFARRAWLWARMEAVGASAPYFVARANEILELGWQRQQVFVAWRPVFEQNAGKRSVAPLEVVAVWMDANADPADPRSIHASRSPITVVTPGVSWNANIRAGDSQVNAYMGTWDTGAGEYSESMVTFEFERVGSVRRWDVRSEDRRVRALKIALANPSISSGEPIALDARR